jgi:hypothetical protein
MPLEHVVGCRLAANTSDISGQEQSPPPGISKSGQGTTVLTVPRGIRPKFGLQMHKETENCASAKIDIWVEAGRVEYVIFAPNSGVGKVESEPRAEGTDIRVGKEDCRIDVVIEPN